MGAIDNNNNKINKDPLKSPADHRGPADLDGPGGNPDPANEEELAIDSLNGRKRAKSSTKMEKETDRNSETAADELSRKAALDEKGDSADLKSYIGELCEDEIKALLEAKVALEEKNLILEEKTSLLEEYEDLLKRKQAEFENYRKRVQKEMEENRRYATSEMVLDIINIIDDFERAIDSAGSSKDFDTLLEGIVIIKNQLMGVLEKKHGVKKIEAVGKEFDPNLHDAIMVEESENNEEDIVVEDFQAGYVMHDRVVRPTKVKVAKAVVGNIEGKSADGGDGS
jgi:molecular chaperone GrpE